MVDTDVHERAEDGHVRHDAFERHARLQVLQRLHAVVELRRPEAGPGIATGLLEFEQDVAHREGAEPVVGELPGLELP